MINKKVAELLNEQVTNEFYSAFLYLSMAFQAEEMNLKGLANWLYVQHQEEHTHAMHIAEYLIDRGYKVTIKKIDAPKVTWATPLAIVKDALKQEQEVTAMFNTMMELAVKEKDYTSISFMQWYLMEQVEEESMVAELIAKYDMAGDNRSAYMLIDSVLADRTFEPSFPVKATPVQLE